MSGAQICGEQFEKYLAGMSAYMDLLDGTYLLSTHVGDYKPDK